MWVDTAQVETFLTLLWRASWQAALLTVLVLILQFILKNRLTARWRYNLWLIVLLRLLLPVLPQSPLSIYNLVATHSPDTTDISSISRSEIPIAGLIDDDAVVADETAPPPLDPQPARTIVLSLAPAPQAAPPAKPFPWLQTAAAVWLVGVLFFLARILIATIRLHRLSRRFDRVADPLVLQLLDACKRDLGVRHQVAILASADVPAPALMGFVRPKLLLPRHLLVDFDRRELRLVLMHELAHVRRRDVAVNWLATLLHTLHWFNPILWLAVARMRTDRELATDELVLAATHADDRRLYGQTILKLLQTLSRRTVLPGMVGILEDTHPLRRRITMIAQFKDKRPWSALALVAVIALAAVTLTDSVRGQDAAGDERKDSTADTVDRDATDSDAASVAIDPATGDAATATDGTRPRAATQRPRGRESNPRDDRSNRFGRSGGAGDLGNELSRLTDPRRPITPGQGVAAMDAHMQATFDRKLPEINFDNVPFTEVIDFLRDITGANIFVNWRALEPMGIERNMPVSMRMKSVSFATVLRLLLESTAPGMMQYDVDGGVIIITTAPHAHNDMAPMVLQPNAAPAQSITRVYDVRDLVDSGSPAIDLESEARDPQLTELRRRRAELLNQFSSEHVEVVKIDSRIRARVSELAQSGQWDHRARASRLNELVQIIQDTIANDQPVSVRGFNTKLIVRAAPEVQREVEQLLTMLREDNAPPARSTSTPVAK